MAKDQICLMAVNNKNNSLPFKKNCSTAVFMVHYYAENKQTQQTAILILAPYAFEVKNVIVSINVISMGYASRDSIKNHN